MGSTSSASDCGIAAAYARDGYFIARDLISVKECEDLKAEALRILAQKGNPNATVFVGVATHSPLYYQFASDPRIVTILEQIMTSGVMFMSDKFVFKSGKHQFATPWHCDRAYWANTRPKLSVWIPFDDCSAENGTLRVVRGSHLREWQHVKGGTGPANEFGNVIEGGQWDPDAEVVCECQRGSAIFFPDSLVHGSCQNSSGLDRYTIISTYHAPAADEPFDLQFAARHVINGVTRAPGRGS